MFYFYHQGSFQLKPLGYVTCKISIYHNIQSLLICHNIQSLLICKFTPNWKEVSRKPGISSPSQWGTRSICVSHLEVSKKEKKKVSNVDNVLLGWSVSGVHQFRNQEVWVLSLSSATRNWSHLTLGELPNVSVMFITH